MFLYVNVNTKPVYAESASIIALQISSWPNAWFVITIELMFGVITVEPVVLSAVTYGA